MATAGRQSAGKRSVLFVAQLINCNDGIATYIETLAGGLKARGIDVHLVSGEVRYDEKSLGKKEKLESVLAGWHVLPDMKRVPRLSVIRKIARLIKAHNISAINTHGLGMLYVGRMLSLMTGLRTVGTYHPSILGSLAKVKKSAENEFNAKQKLFLGLFFPKKLIVLSQETVEFIHKLKLPFNKRVVKIYAGTDLSLFHPPSEQERREARAEYGFEPDDLVLILSGRLAWVKGHDLLVQAVRDLRERRPDLRIKCLFPGSGGSREREQEIMSYAHSGDAADEDSFRFLGFMSDVRRPHWAADIAVLPSRFEGFAISMVEAMATGLPPIRTPAGGATDQIVDGETGYIVPFENPDAIADAIVKLADPERRRELSIVNADRAQQLFGIEPMVDAMLSAYGFPETREPACRPAA